jgi:RNA polymerase sigma factor (sigma-70 family)
MPIFRAQPGLLPRFRQGDRVALEAVYWAYVDKVSGVVRHRLRAAGLRPRPEDAADLVHDVFARAFSAPARDAFDGLRDYGPYLLTLCRNLVADWARRQGREIAVEDDEIEALAPPSVPDDEGLDPGTAALVREYLAGLDPGLRALQEARYQRGLSQEDAARTLGLSRQAVRTLEQKLRKGLGRALARAGRPR